MTRFCPVFLLLFSLNHTFCVAQLIPTPKEHFGFAMGDNYKLTNFTQTEAYFKKLAAASDRIKLTEIGKTEEGRSQYMLIVSAPENLKNLDRFKEISQKLARAEDLTDEQAHALAQEGKAIIWIDGGLHSNETLGITQLIETIYQFATKKDTETNRILNDAVILFVHANPDGHELISNWYMRNPDTLKRSVAHVPKMYQKYIGHDNNRDFYMMHMKETQNMSRQQYIEWMPQIIYNHHQAGPPGSVVAGPPYRDPFNFVFDPLLITSLDAVGAAMNSRLNTEGKPGYTSRSGSVFSTWYNGGLRTTAYFHNITGLLTEMVGSPTPSTIPLIPSRLIPNTATPNPVTPQKWLFKQSVDYSVSLNYAVLDYAVRNREHLLYNIYRMGKNSIDAGNRDHWALSPKRIDMINTAFKNAPKNTKADSTIASPERVDSVPIKFYNAVFKDSSQRDPRAFIISPRQPDFPTAVKFINALIWSGIKIHKATASFTAEGKNYPAGSYIVKTNQAFRPHVIGMFEPQDHPNDFQYPGGPPVRPYDAAGWTPAYSMGFQFDRILNSITAPMQALPYGELQTPPGNFTASPGAGYILNSRINNSFIAINDLLKAGADVYRIKNAAANSSQTAPGSFFIKATGKSTPVLKRVAAELGITPLPISKTPADLTQIKEIRIGLWDTYGGSMPSGWLRFIMEQHHFSYKNIYAREINAGNLRDKYDVIIFPGGAIPGVAIPGAKAVRDTTFKEENIPAEFRPTIGRISGDTSVPQLKRFMEAGGNIVTIGSSTNLAYHLKLPVRNALVEMRDGKERPLAGEKYFIPGSIMRVNIDSAQPAAFGMSSEADVYFAASPVFKIAPDAISKGTVVPLAWFSSDKTLRSGWAFGQEYLQDGVAAFSANVGKGKLYAFGPEITFRSQTYGTFKLLFNQLYLNSQQ